MKYSPHLYARALWEVLETAPHAADEHVLKRFLKIVEKNGDRNKLGKIWTILRDRIVKKNGGRHILLECARPMSARLSAEMSKNFSQKDYVEYAVNPDLIAGVRIVIDGEQEINNTLLRKLRKIFS